MSIMNDIQETPTYNLKVVVNETGVKPDTLRAWERRYGLPIPQRTDGGHRLYSQNDIDTIKWLLARQAEGLSISRAVKLWRTLESQGNDPMHEMGLGDDETDEDLGQYNASPVLDDLREAWIEACLAFDEAKAERLLSRAFAMYSPITACIELLQKGLAEIGEKWYRDEASVQQEHFASALAMRRINSLVSAAPPPTRNGRILIGCPPHEDHTFAPLLLSLMLRYKGWDLLYLGANVPLTRFEATIQSIEPHLIILTAQTLHTAATLAQVSQAIGNLDIPLAFGGSVFTRIPDLQQRIAGFYLGNNFTDAIESVEKILVQKLSSPKIDQTSNQYVQALIHFHRDQAMIEATTWKHLQNQGMPYEHFVNANIHLARDITAALMFGDMKFIEAEIIWVEKLLINYNMPPILLKRYLETYYQVVYDILGGTVGKPIVEWLAKVSQDL